MEFLYRLREANNKRQELWDPERVLSGTVGALFRSNEMAGEAGEAANEVKKLVRQAMGIKGSRTTIEKLSDELSDVIICIDLIAALYGIDMVKAVTKKFNETSDNQGFDIKL